MKKISFCLAVIALLLCACSNPSSTPTNKSQTTPQETTASVTQPEESPFYEGNLADFKFTTYALKQLQDYLGPYCTVAENFWSGAVVYKGTYEYNLVNAALPGSCLRKYTDENTDYYWVYSVYDVADGGYFYIIWGGFEKNYPPEDYETWLSNSSANCMVHVTELKSMEDFSSIETGVSTAEDVVNIDSASFFDFGLGRGTPSWHLLKDGSVLEILYDATEAFHENHQRSELIVKSMAIEERKHTHCMLAYVNPEDLPAQ